MVEKSVLLGYDVGPLQCPEMEAQSWVPQQRGRWAGEVKDWIQLMTQAHPRKEDDIRNLLESMKQPVDKRKESKGSVPTKKPRDLPPLDLGTPVPGESLTLEIKGDNKTIAGWMNGHAKMKTRIGSLEKAQNLLREWWSRGMRSRQRTTDWVTHTFREHNKEADLWACKGAKGRAEEWVDTTRTVWQEVTGECGFWDGSHDNGKCGGGIVLMAFSEPHGWFTFYKKVWPLYQGKVPWMLKWVDAGCLLTIYINGWKSAPAKSVQLFGLLRLRLCLFPLQCIFLWHASHAG